MELSIPNYQRKYIKDFCPGILVFMYLTVPCTAYYLAFTGTLFLSSTYLLYIGTYATANIISMVYSRFLVLFMNPWDSIAIVIEISQGI